MSQTRQYKAFISYSHGDERWAKWLQRALERYRLPKSLRAEHPDLPPRLYPIFRDREELASGSDLSESIQTAMDNSEALIVICSPAAAKSRWVNEEVRRFRDAGGGHRIFCLLVAGRPNAEAADCAFPPVLLLDGDGQPINEPLAADVTPGGDGKRNAMLKIAAGLLGVGVDELKRRDAQRQVRLLSAIAAGSLAIAAVTIGLAIFAMIARQESEIRRHQGEKLIGFMLGDLRTKLEPIGKLDVLDAVGDQAMDYFKVLGRHGTPQEMLDRAKALRQIGDVRFNQGHLAPALTAFEQSLEQARVLHEVEPDNNDYLFELGQAEFWVGYVAWQRNELGQAQASMEKYMRYSQELRDRAPDNPGYRMELAYAHSNLGSVARARGDAELALREFRVAAQISESELKSQPGDAARISDLADIWSWINSTLLDLGRLQESEQAAVKAADLMRILHDQGKDARASAKYADYLLLLADIQLQLGQGAAATDQFKSARDIHTSLLARDPSNAFWRQSALSGDYHRVSLVEPGEWTAEMRQTLETTETSLQALAQKDPSNKNPQKFIAKVLRLEALGELAQGDVAAALRLAKDARDIMGKLTAGSEPTAELILNTAEIDESLGVITRASGDEAGARRIWAEALAGLSRVPDSNLTAKAVRRMLAIDLGDQALAQRLTRELDHAGFKDPRFQPSSRSTQSNQEGEHDARPNQRQS